MLKKVFVIALVLVFTLTLPFSTYAESLEQGLSDVEEALPESVREYGLTAENTADFLDLGNVFSLLFSALKKAFSAAVVPFLATLAFLVALYLLNALLPDKDSPLQKTLCAVFAFGSLVSTFVSVFDVSSAVRSVSFSRPAFMRRCVGTSRPCRGGFRRNGCAVFRAVFCRDGTCRSMCQHVFCDRRDLIRFVERVSLFAVKNA